MQLLILGANSDIAMAAARKFAKAEKADIYLASRDTEQLLKRATDLEIRYQIKAQALAFDALDYESHGEFYSRLDPKPDAVVLAFGYLGRQQAAQESFLEAAKVIETNFLGAVSILEIIAADFETRGRGTIIGLSSAAGERGRQSNYLYGSAKSGLSAYLSGLRNRLFANNVRVITVLPGFVRTKMTEEMALPKPLTAEPEAIADAIYAAYRGRGDVVYAGWYWRWILGVLRNIPESVFKRLKL
jgi:decaprenylphospho-beta-D-erythro-pentofuranosid-2-ulose 2-reductase